jgi:hypothetical protein
VANGCSGRCSAHEKKQRLAPKHPAPDRQHHKKFCTTEQWTLVANAEGKPITHHETYELPLHTGEILRTQISHPVDGTAEGLVVTVSSPCSRPLAVGVHRNFLYRIWPR